MKLIEKLHSEIVKEIIGDYKKDGNIGKIKPKNMKHALDIANAIAYKYNENSENSNKLTAAQLLEKMENFLNEKIN